MNVGWVYDNFFLRHDTGPSHPEQSERLRAIDLALTAAGLLSRMRPLSFGPADPEVLAWVHEPAYLHLLELACDEGMTFIGDRETCICRESYDVARLAAGGVLAACDAAMDGRITRAFCAVRPPGHHAESDHAMGYCLINHVAVAAEYLIRRHRLQRVAVVDWDVHHGNGTQHIFEQRNDVLYISIHEDPRWLYPGTGYETEIGIGPGAGYTLNVPMPTGSGDDAYRRAFEQKITPRLRDFAPQFVLLSAGFDAAAEERETDINLQPESYAWMTEAMCQVADEHADGRLVSVLEGGYDLHSLQRCATAHVEALLAAES